MSVTAVCLDPQLWAIRPLLLSDSWWFWLVPMRQKIPCGLVWSIHVHSGPSFPSQTSSQQIAEVFSNRSCFRRLGCRLVVWKCVSPSKMQGTSVYHEIQWWRNAFGRLAMSEKVESLRSTGRIWSDLVGSGRISEGKNLWWLEETKWSAGAPKPIRAVAWSSHVQLHQAAGVNILTQTAGVRLFHFTVFHRMWHISHTSEIQPTYSCPYLL